jgi:hypothetical protein
MKAKFFLAAVLLSALSIQASGSKKITYYSTRTGKTYHKRDCTVLSGKVIYEVTSDIIAKQKLKPCKKCKPI